MSDLAPIIFTTTPIVPTESKRSTYIIIGITAVIIIIFVGIAIYSIATQSLLFPAYTPPSSSAYYYPGGAVIKLTPEQIAQRKAITTPLVPT